MNGAQKLAAAASVLVVVGLVALAAPVVVGVVGDVSAANAGRAHSEPSRGSSSAAADARSTERGPVGAPAGYVDLGQGVSVPAGGPGACTTTSWLNIRKQGDEPWHATLLGPDLVDMGPNEFANGVPGRDDRGRITTYTVAAGDVSTAIGDRFCLGNGIALGEYNHRSTIQPGDILTMTPDPAVAWIPYYAPTDAPGGFPQAPYQNAMEAMGEAARSGDVAAMRSIWTSRLAPMTFDRRDIDAITQALDGGDLTVLREMFR